MVAAIAVFLMLVYLREWIEATDQQGGDDHALYIFVSEPLQAKIVLAAHIDDQEGVSALKYNDYKPAKDCVFFYPDAMPAVGL